MKKNIFILFITVTFFTFSQKRAVTEDGDVVLLFEDGTWKFEDGSVLESTVIEKNPFDFKTPSTSTFSLKSKKNDFCFWYNPKKWKTSPQRISEITEFELTNTNVEVFAMMISEAAAIDLINLKKIVLENLRKNSTEMTLVKEELRTVNNNEVLYLEVKATLSGIKFHYLYHLITNESGYSQLVLATYENLFAKYKPEMDLFLSGLNVKVK